ncbi:hypothetical protein NC652_005941 [Populus alba x Populus x berolinensis]|nr:hypothetical protein NC652_005941 [Populus alba x Populus x berolinensis]
MGRSRGRRDTARNDRGPWQRGSDHSLGRDSREFPDLLILFGRLLRPNVHNGFSFITKRKESGNVIPKWTRCLRNKNQHGGGVAVLAGMAAASIANSGTTITAPHYEPILPARRKRRPQPKKKDDNPSLHKGQHKKYAALNMHLMDVNSQSPKPYEFPPFLGTAERFLD